MGFLPDSPRRRRRLVVTGGGIAIASAVALLVLLLPGVSGRRATPPAASPTARTVYPTPPSARVPLTAADRREIDALLDRFVPTAVARHDPGAAYDLVTPALRVGTTRADWARGALPVYPFEPRGTTFHYWTLDVSYRDQATFDLLLQPRPGSKDGAIAYTFRVRRIDGRWLVDTAAPRAIFAPQGKPGGIKAAPDFTPPAVQAGSDKSVLGALWLAVPLGLLALVGIVPLAVLVRSWLLEEKPWRRSRERLPMPPLPTRRGKPDRAP